MNRQFCTSGLALLLTIFACSGEKRAINAPATIGGVSQTLPTIRLLSASIPPGLELFPSSPIGVSDSGLIAVASSDGRNNTLALLDTSGTPLLAFGRSGRGPGEIQTAARVFLDGSRVYVYDMASLRLTAFDLEGRFVKQDQQSGMKFPIAVHQNSIAYLELSAEGAFQLTRGDFAGGDIHVVIGQGDSVLLSHFRKPDGEIVFPARAAGRSGWVLGDPERYRLFMYDADGKVQGMVQRDLPAEKLTPRMIDDQMEQLRNWKGPDGQPMDPVILASQAEKLRNKTMEFFADTHGLEFDGSGRLWVIGPTGDSTYADVFADTTFLGRIHIGCSGFGGSFSLNGSLLALLCSDSEENTVIQVYRIMEGDREVVSTGRQ